MIEQCRELSTMTEQFLSQTVKKLECRKEPQLFESAAHNNPRPKRKHKNSQHSYYCISCFYVRVGECVGRSYQEK